MNRNNLSQIIYIVTSFFVFLAVVFAAPIASKHCSSSFESKLYGTAEIVDSDAYYIYNEDLNKVECDDKVVRSSHLNFTTPFAEPKEGIELVSETGMTLVEEPKYEQKSYKDVKLNDFENDILFDEIYQENVDIVDPAKLDSKATLESIEELKEPEEQSSWIRYYTDAQYSEYPVACTVWQIIRSWGWSEAVASGIIGNMMTECGGLTLDLDWDLYDDTGMYYGLCMWSLYWAPGANGLSIEEQMKYLYDTIETNMNYFGGNLDEFLSITDPGYAALYFQWYYEVGNSSETRYAGALEAYEYFQSN